MTSGDEIRRARERAGLTQEQLGAAVGVTLRTVGNWERGATVPRNRTAAVQTALAGYLDDATADSPALRTASDVELLAEIARRFTRTQREEVTGNAQHPAPMTTAPDDPVVATDTFSPVGGLDVDDAGTEPETPAPRSRRPRTRP